VRERGGRAAGDDQARWDEALLKHFVALGAGFMLGAAFLGMMPESVRLTELAPLLILVGYLLIHFFEHTLASHFYPPAVNANYPRHLFLLLAFMLLPAACVAESHSTSSPASSAVSDPTTGTPPDALLIVKRDPCYGTCPWYTLTVLGDGQVLYEGKRFVELVGKFHKRLDEPKLAALRKAFADADFFVLLDTYDNRRVTDLSSVTLFYRDASGRTKQVYARANVSEAVTRLVQSIERIVDWTGFRPVE
jgi:hypothetical protein